MWPGSKKSPKKSNSVYNIFNDVANKQIDKQTGGGIKIQLNTMKFKILNQSSLVRNSALVTNLVSTKQNEANFSPSCIAADSLDIAKIMNDWYDILCRNQQFGITAEAQNITKQTPSWNYIKRTHTETTTA